MPEKESSDSAMDKLLKAKPAIDKATMEQEKQECEAKRESKRKELEEKSHNP